MKGQWPLLTGGLFALLAEVGMRLLEPWPLKFVIDGVIAARGADLPGGIDLDLGTVLILAAVTLLVVVGLRAVTAYAATVCFALAGSRILTRVRAQTYAHLQTLPMSFHDKARTGDLVTRVTADVGRLREVSVTAALPLLGNAITMVGMLVVIAVLDWQLAASVLIVVPVFLLLSTRLSKRITTVSRRQRRADGALATTATESLASMRVVHSYSLQRELQGSFAANNERTLKDGVQAKKLSAGLERKTDVLVGLATAVVLYIGALRVLAGALTPGELVVFITYLKAAFKPMRDLAKYTGRIAQAAASGERIVDVLAERPTIQDAPWARPLPPVVGDIRFEDVQLSYVPGHPVLHGLNLTVHPGRRVALVGPSGAGKSTIAALISRLRDPDAGVVRIDGHDLRDVTLESVRGQVSVVLQESVLFATTISENIRYGRPDAGAYDIVTAAQLAGAHDFIMALPQGYDTVVGERGATLSGGQRQRIAIARAAIRQAPIVVLDEALTGLDEDTEREVATAITRLTASRTTLVITHDLGAARNADLLVWLEDGRVLDSGLPDEVLARRAPEEVRDALV
ncbi:MAG: ABC transporter ATP-binding protein [Propioniciclava sp.]